MKKAYLGGRFNPLTVSALVHIAEREAEGNKSDALRIVIREAARRRGIWDRLVKAAYEEDNDECDE